MDKELDGWICENLGIPPQNFTLDDLFVVIQSFYPRAEFSKDRKYIANVGGAYLALDSTQLDKTAIVIQDPNKNKIAKVMYVVVISIIMAHKSKNKKITIERLF